MYRSITDFKKGYKPRTDTVKDEKCDFLAGCHSILARRRNHFSQLLSVHGVNDVRQTEIHRAETLVSETIAFEVEMTFIKLERHKSPSTDQIPTELVKTGGRTIFSEIHKLIYSIWNEEELPEEWNELITVPI